MTGVYTFQVVESFLNAPLNVLSGITDMQLVEHGGSMMLYTATRAGGGVLAIDVDAGMNLVDSQMLAPGLTLPAEATLDLLMVAGAPRLIVSGANQGSVSGYVLEAGGGLGAAMQLPGGPAGVIGAQALVEVGGSSFLYAARSGESTITGFRVAADGTLTAVGQTVLDGATSGIDISAFTSVVVEGQTYLVSASLDADNLRCFHVGPNGTLNAVAMLGGPQGLPITDPSAIEVVTMAGTTYLVVASAGSSSVSIVAVDPGGQLRPVDHVIDTLDTRFDGVQALATATIGDRVFIIAGGGDDGLNLMTLTPEGRLVLVASALQVPGLALHNIGAMTARVVDGAIDLFIAGEGAGITRLRLDPGPLSPVQTGGDGDDTLTGGTGGDMLSGGEGADRLLGGAGEDVLIDGAGADIMFGGAGRDIFVLSGDGETDVIGDFQIGIDRIDLSDWGRIHSIGALVITATATGAMINYQDETLEIKSANGLAIQPGAFKPGDFLQLWHASLEPPAADAPIAGSNQIDLLVGTPDSDEFRATLGADTMIGDDGFDWVSYRDALAAVRLDLVQMSNNSGLAQGHVFVSIEGLIGSAFNDQLSGDQHDNALHGGGGNDRLIGGMGNDSLVGGDGNDNLNGGIGADRLDGGAGRDRASYRDSAAGLTVDMANTILNTGEAAGDVLIGIEEVEGSQFADVLLGDSLANVLLGLAGNDLLSGRAGNDTLWGGDGDDTLWGGAGSDRMDGGGGFDTVTYADSTAAIRIDLMTPTLNTGDATGDVVFAVEAHVLTGFNDAFWGNAEANHVFAGSGNDTLDGREGDDVLWGGTGNDTLIGGDGNDILIGGTGGDRLDGGLGFDIASYAGAALAITVDLMSSKTRTGDAVKDVLIGIEGLGGSAFNDKLSGDAADNVLRGEAGADSLVGRGGQDTLQGGTGNDTLIGGAGGDWLDGGEGFDVAAYTDAKAAVRVDLADASLTLGDAAGDVLAGIEGLWGSAYADTLAGDGGANQIIGGAGNDQLFGRGGNDKLIGGSGADILDGGAGHDLASYATATQAVRIHLEQPWLNRGDAAGDSLISIEEFELSAHGDTFTGDAADNLVRGMGGNDLLEGGLGLDTLFGGTGNDTLRGGDGDDLLIGGAGADRIEGGAGIDTASYADAAAGVAVYMANNGNKGDATGDVLVGVENLIGSAFNDTLSGDLGANLLEGGAGNDVLIGGAGADWLDGGEGFDVAAYTDAKAAVSVDLANAALALGDAAGDVLTGIEGLWGSAYADTLAGDGGANQIIGGAGNDLLSGRNGNDTLTGGAGADILDGGAGHDIASYATAKQAVLINLDQPDLYRGDALGDSFISIEEFELSSASDTFIGNAAANLVRGMGGNDKLDGGLGADTLIGGSGKDTLRGGDGDDLLIGGTGADRIEGGEGIDTASYADAAAAVAVHMSNKGNKGDASGDVLIGVENLIGSAFNDTLSGDVGANRLEGGAGNDVLLGLAGADTLVGGAGNDILTGGLDADTFVFHAGHDVITDFTDGLDRILIDPALWAGGPPDIEELLATAVVTDTGLMLSLGASASLDIRGVFEASLLFDEIAFL